MDESQLNEGFALLRNIASRLESIENNTRILATKQGALTQTNEEEILNLLHRKNRIYKEDIIISLDISDNTALNLMKRLESKHGEVYYSAGRGSKRSFIALIDNTIIAQKAKSLIGIMRPASSRNRKELTEELGLEKEKVELNDVVNYANKITANEFRWDFNILVRMR